MRSRRLQGRAVHLERTPGELPFPVESEPAFLVDPLLVRAGSRLMLRRQLFPPPTPHSREYREGLPKGKPSLSERAPARRGEVA